MDTKKLRQKILDLAIHGKLVPQDPNDEPASVLLERIKVEKEQLIKEGKIKRSRKSAKTSDTPHYEQVKLEVPNSWYMVSVSDLFLLNPKSELDDNMKVGFIPMALVEDGFSGNHFYEERTWKDVKRGYCHFQNGDIGIAKISPCFENRKSTIFKNLPNTYGAGTTELVILRPIKVYTKFYLYLFKSDWYVKEGTKYFKGVVGQQRVHKEIFTDLHIPLPPFAEQQRIVEEIEYWFALIDQIEQDKSDLQTAIRQTKSKILDLAIHGKLVLQNPNDEPASELLKRINPKAEITCDNGHYPVGWIDVILGDIFYHNTGKALNSSNKEGVLRNYLTTSNVYWNQFDLSLVKQMPFRDNELEKCTVQKGDLLVCEGGDVGRSAIWNFDYNICIQNHIHRLRPKGDLNVSFYYYVLRFLKEHNRIGGKGIGLLGLSSNELHKIGMPLPPRKEQDRIVLKIEELFSVLDNIENALEA
ncbi:restriction endonuclease subunit S [Rikenella microfusus]|nr:restriction endonuclease subunit S [Rikenella microfusus]